jgi:hypothetical protein
MPDILRRFMFTSAAHCVPAALLKSAQWGGGALAGPLYKLKCS